MQQLYSGRNFGPLRVGARQVPNVEIIQCLTIVGYFKRRYSLQLQKKINVFTALLMQPRPSDEQCVYPSTIRLSKA